MRSSACGAIDLCEQQFFLSYILGIPQKTGKKAEMGTILHKVMEIFANCKKCLQNNKTEFLDDKIGNVEFTNEIILTDRFTHDIFARVYAYYTLKSLHHYTGGDCNKINGWMDEVINFKMFDPRTRNIVAAEQFFDIEIEEEWAKYEFINPSDNSLLKGNLRLKGTIDLITQVDDNTYELIDWKTGQRKNWATGEEKTFDKLCEDIQLHIYYYVMTLLYPHIKNFIITIYYVRDGGPFTMAFSREHNKKKVLEGLKTRVERIKKIKRPALKSADPNYWFCKRVCHYGKTQHPKDESKTICRYISDKIKKYGIDNVIATETDVLHNIGKYQNPGE